MTQGYPPPARGSNAGAEQDTADGVGDRNADHVGAEAEFVQPVALREAHGLLLMNLFIGQLWLSLWRCVTHGI